MKKCFVEKKMLFVLMVCTMGCFVFSGCVEPFLAGFGAGAVAVQELGQNAQADLIATVNEMNAKKSEYEAFINQIEDVDLKAGLQSILDEQTVEALKDLKETDWKNPVTSGGYGLALIGVLTAAYQKYQRTKGIL
jgi:hypothetical protein